MGDTIPVEPAAAPAPVAFMARNRFLALLGTALFGAVATALIPRRASANECPPWPCHGACSCDCCNGLVSCDGDYAGGACSGGGSCWLVCASGWTWECCDYLGNVGGGPGLCICFALISFSC